MNKIIGLKEESKYLTIEVIANYNLSITATEEGKEFILENLTKVNSQCIWAELTEYGCCNSGFAMVEPSVIGALTESPIIGYDFSYYNEEELENMNIMEQYRNPKGIKQIEYIWWFPNYMVIDELEKLLTESIVFESNFI